MRVIFLLLISILFCSCSNSEWVSHSSSVEVAEDSLAGMVRVNAVDAIAVLGTKNKEARASERPEMKVKLSYDFSLGQHEVTCDEFDSLMSDATGLVLDCENGNLPATNLTYYDAVLYANERSKAEGFDTAYTYTNAVFDSEKHCTSLEGFAYRPEAKAFRLPTESEWVLAASQDWNVDSSWNGKNSNYQLHPVCTKMALKSKFCDMAGNAMEWVNDWLGYFRDTTVANYVGAPDGGKLGERVVKGGCYRNEANSISLYSRGDVYTVTSSTRADYVGFRLAFGDIPDAVWMNSTGSAKTSRVIPLASSEKMHDLAGVYKVKLAFRNDLTGNLAYIDYSNGNLSVVEIEDTLDVYHPDISPDGKKVAFCTGLEGVSGKSAIYVRNLDAEGSGLVKFEVKSAAIPRWRVLENGDTVIVYVTSAANNKDEKAFMKTSTGQVKFQNGMFWRPQKLFDGAYHGGVSVDNSLAVTGARLLRAHDFFDDAVWYNGEQACNVSLAKDGSKRTLFLDFAGKTGQKFVGKSYATHERLLIADSTGKLIQSVGAPSGLTFDHSEWATGVSDIAVATLTNSNGAHQKIVLVNLSDSSIVELVEGDEVWHPNLWVQEVYFAGDDVRLDLDSAGVYYNNQGGEAAIILRYKMELLWNYKDTSNVVVLGSSRSLNGIIPSMLSTNFFAINLSIAPNMMVVSDYLFKNYVYPHVHNLKYLVVALDIDLWFHEDSEEQNFFYKEYKKYPGYVYDKNHNYWKDEFPNKLPRLTEASLGMEYYQNRLGVTRGYNEEPAGSWEKKPPVDNDSAWMKKNSAAYEANLEHLKNILKLAEKKDIYVIGVIFPQSPNFKNTGSFGRYGIRRSEAPALLEEFKEMEKTYPNFVFWDENKMGDHGYKNNMAINRDHLSYFGAERLTRRLDALLKKLK